MLSQKLNLLFGVVDFTMCFNTLSVIAETGEWQKNRWCIMFFLINQFVFMAGLRKKKFAVRCDSINKILAKRTGADNEKFFTNG